MNISLIIPIKNEGESLQSLIASIQRQTFQPAEVILVDGGSTDNTVELAERLISGDAHYKLIKTPQASPGKGRNVGATHASCEWLAFTDAGIKLEKTWLENLIQELKKNPETEVIYGNFSPKTDTLFEKCAMIAYVPPQKETGIRSKFIASSLMKKMVWEEIGGFPDLRAAEDLLFMEEIERHRYEVAYAPDAMVHWHLRPDFSSTFKKFVLYSKHNVWARRQWDWHYGIAKHYFVVIPLIVFMLMYSWWLLIAVFFWLFIRTSKRILAHRSEIGFGALFNPAAIIVITLLILTIDAATFVGWVEAVANKTENPRIVRHSRI